VAEVLLRISSNFVEEVSLSLSMELMISDQEVVDLIGPDEQLAALLMPSLQVRAESQELQRSARCLNGLPGCAQLHKGRDRGCGAHFEQLPIFTQCVGDVLLTQTRRWT
jgi:hypothetical protein